MKLTEIEKVSDLTPGRAYLLRADDTTWGQDCVAWGVGIWQLRYRRPGPVGCFLMSGCGDLEWSHFSGAFLLPEPEVRDD